MIRLKTELDIKRIAESGKILSEILFELLRNSKPGVSLVYLEKLARKLFKKYKAKPAFLGFKPDGGPVYPATICTSVNEQVVHGIPSRYILKSGDILTIDSGINYKNYFADTAYTIGIGKISPIAEKLIAATRKSLENAIKQAKPSNRLGDIGFTIQETIKNKGFSVVKELCGHGVGYQLHEEPQVLNFGQKNSGGKLLCGMVLAIEPMACTGCGRVKQLKDGTFVTIDNSLSAHFEQTIAVTRDGPLVLTPYLKL